jgi:hypothetical protein
MILLLRYSGLRIRECRDARAVTNQTCEALLVYAENGYARLAATAACGSRRARPGYQHQRALCFLVRERRSENDSRRLAAEFSSTPKGRQSRGSFPHAAGHGGRWLVDKEGAARDGIDSARTLQCPSHRKALLPLGEAATGITRGCRDEGLVVGDSRRGEEQALVIGTEEVQTKPGKAVRLSCFAFWYLPTLATGLKFSRRFVLGL